MSNISTSKCLKMTGHYVELFTWHHLKCFQQRSNPEKNIILSKVVVGLIWSSRALTSGEMQETLDYTSNNGGGSCEVC